jgi:benzylsuccinate CoA-transferase BbsF subunit
MDGSGGRYVDLAARDALLWTLTSSAATADPGLGERQGNNNGTATPHGVYRCAGDNRWVSIAVQSDLEWRALTQVIDRPDLYDRLDVRTVEYGPLGEAIDLAITQWTSMRSPQEVTAQLQAQGIASFPSYDNNDIWKDQHIRDRRFFQRVDEAGWVAASPWVVDGQRMKVESPVRDVPARQRVFHEILNLDCKYIDELISQGILG